jgi:hypothetical protein
MLTTTRAFLLLGSLICGCAGLALGACSSSSGGSVSSPDGGGGGGADATHTGHDASGGGFDSSFGGLDSATGDDASPGNESGTGVDSGHHDAGKGGDATGGGDGGGGDAGGEAATEGGVDASVDVNCGSTPTLHQDEAGTIFCTYDFDSGVDLVCPTGQQCCLGGAIDFDAGIFAPQQCSAFGGTCANPPGGGAIPIECAQNADCTANGQAGDVCCLQGAIGPAVVAGCGYYKATYGSAVVCESPSAGRCAAGEVQICSTQADCPIGTTCTPMKWKLFQLGFCQ